MREKSSEVDLIRERKTKIHLVSILLLVWVNVN